MKPGQMHEIEICLDDINHLFSAPETDYFAEKPVYYSGLDTAVIEIRKAGRRSEHRLVILLPAEKISPELHEAARRALAYYCAHKIEESRREVSLLRREGFEALQTGLVFMAVCLSVSLYVSKQIWIPELIQTFVGQGLSVVAWVSMWKPIDIFLYQWWPHWQTRFVFDKIRKSELVIRSG
jgi:hypothetical protein